MNTLSEPLGVLNAERLVVALDDGYAAYAEVAK